MGKTQSLMDETRFDINATITEYLSFFYSSVHNEVAAGSKQDKSRPDIKDQHGESISKV